MEKTLKILRYLTGLGTLLLLLLLAWQCIDIYIEGNATENLDANGVHLQSVYHMEDVAERLSALAIPFAVFCAVTVISVVLHTIYGTDATKGSTVPITAGKQKCPDSKKQHMIRIALFSLAALFILLGVMNGGWYDVLVKAINICTECIGLG